MNQKILCDRLAKFPLSEIGVALKRIDKWEMSHILKKATNYTMYLKWQVLILNAQNNEKSVEFILFNVSAFVVHNCYRVS